MKSLLSCKTITKIFIEELFQLSDNSQNLNLNGKILINAFFESSTRTSLSFECAMNKLGGKVITFNKDFSSMNKGESFEDTIKTLSLYGDVLVLRHPEKGQVEHARSIIDIPLINAGDGNGEHPTQALLDLYTIYKKYGIEFINKKILFVGDVKNSRTIHSLLQLIYLYPGMKVYTYSYKGLGPSDKCVENIKKVHNQDIVCINDFNEFKPSYFDIIYSTRLQKERLDDSSQMPDIIIDKKFVNKLHKNAIVMHPLPRNNELSREVDNDDRCYYFKQMKYGLKLRMALIHKLMS
jgi:aspartate carbamoyltransferase